MKKTYLLALISLSLLPAVALAADGPVSALFSGNMDACKSGCIAPLLNGLFTASLSIGAMLAVLRIAYAGWLYMGSADMWSSQSEAKGVFQDAILGLLLLLGVWLILYQINPDILNLDFTRHLSGSSQTTTVPSNNAGSAVSNGYTTYATSPNTEVRSDGSCVAYDQMGVGTPVPCP